MNEAFGKEHHVLPPGQRGGGLRNGAQSPKNSSRLKAALHPHISLHGHALRAKHVGHGERSHIAHGRLFGFPLA
jgi:hypothetical protein